MCGIAGLFNFSQPFPIVQAAENVVRRMISVIAYRGPDAEGVWVDPNGRCIFGHRRLSIIDTSDAGRQPMVGNDGRWVITFNGEIYNFQELRGELEAEGEKFRGRTDTEVLLAGIARWGVEILPRLDGMFAFAAFNLQSGEILLARDPFGEKPLYYTDLPGGGLAFASELHCLEHLPGFDPEVSLDAMAEVLMFQYIGAPRTIYRSVKKLQPGHWLKLLPEGRSEAGRYFEFVPGRDGFDPRPISDLADELEDILLTSLRRRLISDVPLGAFLSGGVDSSTVCALIRKRLNGSLTTFSMGFEGAEESEHETARQFAAHLHTDHHDRVLRPDTAHFLDDIGSVLDEPNADSSCMPTYFLSEFARRQVTVAISGDGGDEMFGGYGRYFDTLLEQRTGHRSLFAPSWTPGAAYYSGRILVFEPSRIEALFGHVPDGLGQHLRNLREEVNRSRHELLCALRKTDAENYMPGAVLPKVDRMSMRHSLEVRTPFLNIALARFAERLRPEVMVSGRRGKLVLRELAYRYLPKHLIDMPKQGFGIPVSKWGKMELLSLAERKLKDDDSRLLDMLGSGRIERFLSHQRTNEGFSSYQLWGVVMLESWLRVHKAHLPNLPKTDNRLDEPEQPRPAFSAGWIAPNVLAVMPREIALKVVSRSTTPEQRNTSNHYSKAVVELFRRIAPVYFLRRFSAQEAFVEIRDLMDRVDLCDGLRRAGFSLRGAVVIIFDASRAESITPETVNSLQSLGAKGLIYPHPHQPEGPYVRVNFHNGLLRRIFNVARLRARAIALWSLSDATTLTGYSRLVGPFGNFPASTDREFSHQIMIFEGRKQLPPIPSTHESIAVEGEGRYSVWNQHVFFSVTKVGSTAENTSSKRYWAVENNPRNSALLSMTCELLSEDSPGKFACVAMIESWLNVGETSLSEANNSLPASANLQRCLAGWVAPGLIAVLPQNMSFITDGPLNTAEERTRSDRLATAIVQLCCFAAPEFEQVLGRGEFKTRELPAEADLGIALTAAGFSLNRATVVVIDTYTMRSVTPQTVTSFERLGANGLVYAHPHRLDGQFVRIEFNRGGWLRRLIDIARLRRRAIASWSTEEMRHVRGFSHMVGPLERLPVAQDQELSHKVIVFEGKRQLPPIPSTHESIATQGRGRYSVWNQRIFFSVADDLNSAQMKRKRYWAVENNARNSALLPMTVTLTESGSLPASDFVSRLNAYLDTIKAQGRKTTPNYENSKSVIVLTHALSPGGAERQWCYLAIGLKQIGYNVKLVTCNWLDGELAHYHQLLKSNDIEPYELGQVGIASVTKTLASNPTARNLLEPTGTPYWIRLVQLVALLCEIRPTAVFAQLDPMNILAGIAGSIARTPKIIFSFRNVNPSNFSYLRNDWFLPAYRALIKNPAVVLSGNSRAGNRDYAEWIGVPCDQVKYVGNAIGDGIAKDLSDSPEPSRATTRHVPLILGVFRLSEEKRPLLFLEICEKVKSIVPNTQVAIAGIGPMEAELRAEIQKRQISHYIKLLGRRNDIYELMRSSSILLLTSAFEGTPNVVLEAQALGLPVVATRVGGVPDIVVDGETGFLVDVDDKAVMVEACVRIMTDNNLRVRMREAARSHIARSFTVQGMVDDYLNLLKL